MRGQDLILEDPDRRVQPMQFRASPGDTIPNFNLGLVPRLQMPLHIHRLVQDASDEEFRGHNT